VRPQQPLLKYRRQGPEQEGNQNGSASHAEFQDIKGPVGCHGKDLFDKQLRFRTRNERISRHGKGIIEKPFLAEDIGHGFPLCPAQDIASIRRQFLFFQGLVKMGIQVDAPHPKNGAKKQFRIKARRLDAFILKISLGPIEDP